MNTFAPGAWDRKGDFMPQQESGILHDKTAIMKNAQSALDSLRNSLKGIGNIATNGVAAAAMAIVMGAASAPAKAGSEENTAGMTDSTTITQYVPQDLGDISNMPKVADASGKTDALGEKLLRIAANEKMMAEMAKAWVNPVVVEKVRATTKLIQDAAANGTILSTEFVKIEEVNPIEKTGKWLNGLISGLDNDGSKIPKKTLSEIIGADEITINNYVEAFTALFDNGYGDNAALKKIYINKVSKYRAGGKESVVEAWFTRFKDYSKKMIHGSGPEFLKLLINCESIAFYQSLEPKRKETFSPAVVSQAGELALMTSPNVRSFRVTQLVAIEDIKGNVTYTTQNFIVPTDATFDVIGFPEGKQAAVMAANQWNVEQKKSIDTRADTAATRADTAATMANTEFRDRYNMILGEFTTTGRSLISMLDQFKAKQNDAKYISDLNTLLQTFKEKKIALDAIIAEDKKRILGDNGKYSQTYDIIITEVWMRKILAKS